MNIFDKTVKVLFYEVDNNGNKKEIENIEINNCEIQGEKNLIDDNITFDKNKLEYNIYTFESIKRIQINLEKGYKCFFVIAKNQLKLNSLKVLELNFKTLYSMKVSS